MKHLGSAVLVTVGLLAYWCNDGVGRRGLQR